VECERGRRQKGWLLVEGNLGALGSVRVVRTGVA